MFSAIFSRTRNNYIGKKNKLLVKSSKDFDWFVKKTTGKTIIMGGSTYRSIGRPLPNRRMVVLTRDESLSEIKYLTCYNNIDSLLQNEKEGVIIGGGEIFQQFWPYVNEVYETIFECELNGDTFAPPLINFKLETAIEDYDLQQNLLMVFNHWKRT